MSRSRASSSSTATGVLLTVITPSSRARTTWFDWLLCSGWLGGGGWGSEMSRPICASGVTTMKMMSSTSITSMRGVMLMSAIAPDSALMCVLSPRRRVFSISWWCLPWGSAVYVMALPLYLALGDERDFLDPRLAAEVHDLHHLGVGQRVVRLEVHHARALGEVLEALLDEPLELVLVVQPLGAEVGRLVLLDGHDDRLGLVLALLGVARLRELHVDTLLEHGRDDHEDDEQHDHDVGHGRDVDVRHRSALLAADCHCHGGTPSQPDRGPSRPRSQRDGAARRPS